MQWFQVLTLILTGGIFPFVTMFFVKNQKLHEETQRTQALQDITLAVHNTRIETLEQWRLNRTH